MTLKNLEKKELNFFLIFLIGLIIIIVLAFILIYPQKKTEGFTEVFLSKNSNEAKINQPFTVQFYIQNNEGKKTTYYYKVVGQETKEGSVTIKDGESRLVKENITFNTLGNIKVTVEVKKKEQENPFTLWFWVKVIE